MALCRLCEQMSLALVREGMVLKFLKVGCLITDYTFSLHCRELQLHDAVAVRHTLH